MKKSTKKTQAKEKMGAQLSAIDYATLVLSLRTYDSALKHSGDMLFRRDEKAQVCRLRSLDPTHIALIDIAYPMKLYSFGDKDWGVPGDKMLAGLRMFEEDMMRHSRIEAAVEAAPSRKHRTLTVAAPSGSAGTDDMLIVQEKDLKHVWEYDIAGRAPRPDTLPPIPNIGEDQKVHRVDILVSAETLYHILQEAAKPRDSGQGRHRPYHVWLRWTRRRPDPNDDKLAPALGIAPDKAGPGPGNEPDLDNAAYTHYAAPVDKRIDMPDISLPCRFDTGMFLNLMRPLHKARHMIKGQLRLSWSTRRGRAPAEDDYVSLPLRIAWEMQTSFGPPVKCEYWLAPSIP